MSDRAARHGIDFEEDMKAIVIGILIGLVLTGAPLAMAAPALSGQIVYHSYVSYGDLTSQMFLLNLSTGVRTSLSAGWTNVRDAMNGKFSPDGTKIAFMAKPLTNDYWDIFLYTVNQAGNPINLT